MGHDGFHELTAAYALNALDEPEASEYEAHLGRCATCQEELAAFQETAASLAFAADAPAGGGGRSRSSAAPRPSPPRSRSRWGSGRHHSRRRSPMSGTHAPSKHGPLP